MWLNESPGNRASKNRSSRMPDSSGLMVTVCTPVATCGAGAGATTGGAGVRCGGRGSARASRPRGGYDGRSPVRPRPPAAGRSSRRAKAVARQKACRSVAAVCGAIRFGKACSAGRTIRFGEIRPAPGALGLVELGRLGRTTGLSLPGPADPASRTAPACSAARRIFPAFRRGADRWRRSIARPRGPSVGVFSCATD